MKNYEWVELPSKGRCYPIDSPLRDGRVKVEYLTAMDENIMFSHKLRSENIVCSTLLKKKVLGDFDVLQLCSGDKEAIVLWIMKENYGNIYNIPNSQDSVNLDNIKYKEILFECDDNGYFTYITENDDKIIYRLLPFQDEEELIRKVTDETVNNDKISMEEIYVNFAKKILSKMIVSINNMNDEEILRSWFENISYDTLHSFQTYVTDNSPGLDLKTTNGLVFDDTIFFNIK